MSDGTSALFELELELPDACLKANAKRLVGFAERFARIHQDLRLLVDQEGLEKWSTQFYPKQRPAILEVLIDRYPLVIFHGDVGTGKTATAEAASYALASELKKPAMLFKLSTRVRGNGNVGEMSSLINQAFEIVVKEAGKAKLSFLIIDEADSLASSRNGAQSHHEDKVAVNTLIQKIDFVRRLNGRVLVIFCTNRFDALDPAIVRRAARIEEFSRPTDAERHEFFRMDCDGLGFDDHAIEDLVKLTNPKEIGGIGYTFSDLRTRLIPEALAQAYPTRTIEAADFAAAIQKVKPSPSIV